MSVYSSAVSPCLDKDKHEPCYHKKRDAEVSFFNAWFSMVCPISMGMKLYYKLHTTRKKQQTERLLYRPGNKIVVIRVQTNSIFQLAGALCHQHVLAQKPFSLAPQTSPKYNELMN